MTKWKTVRLRYRDWVVLNNDMIYISQQVDWLQERYNESICNWYLTMTKPHIMLKRNQHRWILDWNKPDRLPGHQYERI